MSNDIEDQPEIIPFGEGGAELGMTRGEIQEHIDWLWSYQHMQTEFVIEMIFAWLVAMTFIAARLSTKQFVVAHIFYLTFLLQQFMAINDSLLALTTWQDRNGLAAVSADIGGFAGFYMQYLLGDLDVAIFFAAVVASVWWSISCRKTGTDLLNKMNPD